MPTVDQIQQFIDTLKTKKPEDLVYYDDRGNYLFYPAPGYNTNKKVSDVLKLSETELKEEKGNSLPKK